MRIDKDFMAEIPIKIQQGRSPYELLHNVWKSQNKTVTDLYLVLVRTDHLRAARVLRDLVEPQYRLLCDVGSTTHLPGHQARGKPVNESDLPPPPAPPSASYYNEDIGVRFNFVPNISGSSKVGVQDTCFEMDTGYPSRPGPRPAPSETTDVWSQSDSCNITRSSSSSLDDSWNDSIAFEKRRAAAGDYYPGYASAFAMEKERRCNVHGAEGDGPQRFPVAADTCGDRSLEPSAVHSCDCALMEGSLLSCSDGRTSTTLGQQGSGREQRVCAEAESVACAIMRTQHVSYDELYEATAGFAADHELGHGEFGIVYRARVRSSAVAVKRFVKRQGLVVDDAAECKQINNVLRHLSRYQHENILQLCMYSIGGPESCLVYQYMPNGSLLDRLLFIKGYTAVLTWQQRLAIMEGTANAILFLHCSQPPLIHGNVKSANILLDKHMEPKLGDFGLAQPAPQGDATHATVSMVMGSAGYLPREYLDRRELSAEVDVYSYGVVMLEVATGRQAQEPASRKSDYLVDAVKALKKEGHSFTTIVDSHLEQSRMWLYLSEEFINLGLCCTHQVKKRRIPMQEVQNQLVKMRRQCNEL
ncbi:PREDICTED: serine/threonine-protein kinase CDL1-like isoform X2 [Priapulus caudatus]|nr:PREDICTED: serine/threonine-protein kinase CDL1-like isoform X2 [Priapulus caudatus]